MAIAKKLATSNVDEENPEWTEEDFARARPAREMMPEALFEKLTQTEAAQKTGTKQQVTLHLDSDVVEHFKAGGSGWQDRMNEVLRRAVRERQSTDAA